MNIRNRFSKIRIISTVLTLFVMAAGMAGLFGSVFTKSTVTVYAFAPTLYKEYNFDGVEIAPNMASEEKMELGYITCDALIGTYGELICNPPDSLTEICFELEFAPAVAEGEELKYNHQSTADGSIEIIDENNSIIWYYGGVGVYKVLVYVVVLNEEGEPIESESEPPETLEYYFVCRSGQADFEAHFTKSGSASHTVYNSFSGELELKLFPGQNYQQPENTGFEVSNVLSPFQFDFTENGIVVTIQKNVKNGDYSITFDVTYKRFEIDDFGMIVSLTEETETITASLKITSKPHDTSLRDALFGLAVLGVLGGALYGINFMSKRMQEKRDTVQMK